MTRLTVDHHLSKHFDPAPLVDESGRSVLGIVGGWAQVNAQGRTELFVSPDLGRVAKASAIDGLIGGLIGGVNQPPSLLRNTGDGRQTLKRAKVPVRGVPFRWDPVATIDRTRRSGVVDEFAVAVQEPGLPPVTFANQVTDVELAGVANGFADPRYGVYDLVHADGRTIVRHWATIDRDLALARSTFDVEDESFPLAVAVMLCLARYLSWRF